MTKHKPVISLGVDNSALGAPIGRFSPAQREAMHRLVELAFSTGVSGRNGMQTASTSPTGQQAPAPITGAPVPDDLMMEVGATGLKAYMGFIHEAYNSELNWPNVYTLYNRLRRSDPEMSIVRQAFTAMSRQCSLEWVLPDDPTDQEKEAQEFGYEVLDDFEGGVTALLEQCTSHVPFMGWGYWEVVPGLRKLGWTPPTYSDPSVNKAVYQDPDDWRSQYDDGRIGIRRFGWRDHSSFWRWDMGSSMKLKGLVQRIPPGYPPPLYREIPLERACHLRFGDTVNPEGLTPLEAVWRLERMKFGFEVVQGIGYEHAAGHLSIKRTEPGTISTSDRTNAKVAARAIMTAQEGNFAYWPFGIDGELKDVPFQAGKDLDTTIKYYGILKLQVYNMGWAAMSTTSSHGSLAAVEDASSMFLLTYNAMMEGFGDQLDDQVGKRLFAWNSGAFPGLTMRTGIIKSKSYPGKPTKTGASGPISPAVRRPKLTVTSVDKVIDLAKLGAFLTAIQPMLPLGEDDIKAIRKLSGFLPETLPNQAGVNPTAEGETPPPQQPAGKGAFVSYRNQDLLRSTPSVAQLTHDVIQQLKEFGKVRDTDTVAGPDKVDLSKVLMGKKPWKTFGPFEVWEADGELIRGHKPGHKPIFQDFTEGGNPARYPWLRDGDYPQKVILVVDSGLIKKEWPETTVHEITEFNAFVIDGLKYDTAHTNHANPEELKVGQEPSKFEAVIAKQVKRYEKYLEDQKK